MTFEKPEGHRDSIVSTSASDYRWSAFPTGVLPGTLKQLVREGAAALGCDESMVALPALTVVAAAIGNSVQLQISRSWSAPAILWAIVVAPSGSMKSPAFSLAMRFLRKRQAKALAEFRKALHEHAAVATSYEAQVKIWKQKARKPGSPPLDPPVEPEPPACERFTTSDTTVEALASLLEKTPRGLLVAVDEIAGLIRSFDRYAAGKGGGEVAKWLSLYDAGDLIIDRKTGPKPTTHVPVASVSICGTCQPSVLAKVMAGENAENGMQARFLVARPPKRIARFTEREVSVATEARFDALLDNLLGVEVAVDEHGTPRPRMLPMAADAKRSFVSFQDRIAERSALGTERESAIWSKCRSNALRLALVLHMASVADGGAVSTSSVGSDAVNAGCVLAEWFANEALRVQAEAEEGEAQHEARQLIDIVRAKGGSITVRDLKRASRRYQPTARARTALQDLAGLGFGTMQREPSEAGGRPSEVFVLADAFSEGPLPRGVAKTQSEKPYEPGNWALATLATATQENSENETAQEGREVMEL